MPFNDNPRVRDLEKYAKKHGFDQVVCIGIREKEGSMTSTSYGEDSKKCDKARKLIKPVETAIRIKVGEMVKSNEW